MVLSDLPEAMAEPGGRGAGYWPLIQLIKDWNNQPESRELMLAGGLPEGTAAVTAAKIAAVVHALCERDGHPAAGVGPQRPLSHRCGRWSPTWTGVAPRAAAAPQRPGVCRYHRVYFSLVTLRST